MTQSRSNYTRPAIKPGTDQKSEIHVEVIIRPVRALSLRKGNRGIHDWKIVFRGKSSRVFEPLMGWKSSDDTVSGMKLNFPDRSAAIEFAQSKGWTMSVIDPLTRRRDRFIPPAWRGSKPD